MNSISPQAEDIELIQDEFFPKYTELSKKLYFTALSILKNPEDAEDAVQDTVILGIKSYSKLLNKESFNCWIMKILINRCKRMLFLRVRFFKENEQDNKIQEQYLSDESIILKEALSKLSYKYRVILTLRYFDDMSIKEISHILQCPEGTIKSQLHRGMKKLKIVLGDDLSE
ncbi:MAG: sigma-70 family RNA polymerase sigma factor [Clostridiales bacterium]|nr:sigma-70 family RNA polymerase sigma factor [Clostridiales bacterium]